MNEKQVSQLVAKEELLQWLKRRRQEPLYVGSDEQEGMTLSYVNPALIEDDEENF